MCWTICVLADILCISTDNTTLEFNYRFFGCCVYLTVIVALWELRGGKHLTKNAICYLKYRRKKFVFYYYSFLGTSEFWKFNQLCISHIGAEFLCKQI